MGTDAARVAGADERGALNKRAVLLCSLWLAGHGAYCAPACAAEAIARSDAPIARAPAPRHYERAALEELGLLALGLAQYFYNHEANSVDWDLSYDWPSLEQKLTGKAYAFDTNAFDTNFITHPASGTLYYLAARSNGLSLLASFGYAFTASTLWEFFGEYRERVSINDVLVTPLAGLALGEVSHAFGEHFSRSCAPLQRTLGLVLSPLDALHDSIDAVHRQYPCAASAARSNLSFSDVILVQNQGRDDWHTHMLYALSLAAEVSTLAPTQLEQTEFFADGNVAEFAFEIATGARGAPHLRLAALSLPFGAYSRSLSETARLQELTVGALIATEYERHDYDTRDERGDRLFLITFPGIGARYRRVEPGVELRLALDLGVSFGGADAFIRAGVDQLDSLTSVSRAHGYNHVAGFSVTPRLSLAVEDATWTLEARSDRLFALRAFDRERAHGGSASETRRRASVAFTYPRRSWLRLRLQTGLRERGGSFLGKDGSALEYFATSGLELGSD